MVVFFGRMTVCSFPSNKDNFSLHFVHLEKIRSLFRLTLFKHRDSVTRQDVMARFLIMTAWESIDAMRKCRNVVDTCL